MCILRSAAGALAGAGLLVSLAAGAEDDLEMTISFTGPPEIQVIEDPVTGEESFFGAITGVVRADDSALFAGTSVNCEFDGHTFESRGFSCGFTTAESVAGVCLFATENGDTAVAEWRCQTGATLTSDARCEGTASWVDGTGAFAGITGRARLHSDLFLFPTEGFSLWKGRWSVARLASLDR